MLLWLQFAEDIQSSERLYRNDAGEGIIYGLCAECREDYETLRRDCHWHTCTECGTGWMHDDLCHEIDLYLCEHCELSGGGVDGPREW